MALGNWIDIGQMDDLSRMDSPIHRLDARAKIVATLAFLIAVMSFPRHEISALTPFLIFPFALLHAARIPAGTILRKILVAAPFALVVGIFNPLIDREPVAAIGGHLITGGWLSFASIMLRFALTVSAALILIACTGMHRLAAGLEQLGAPRLFVVQLLFLYRYIFVTASEGARMTRAVALRSPRPGAMPLRAYGPLLGHLLLRAMDRAGRIHRAMEARGFDGEIRVLHKARMRTADWLFIAGSITFFTTARLLNLADLLGQLTLRNLP